MSEGEKNRPAQPQPPKRSVEDILMNPKGRWVDAASLLEQDTNDKVWYGEKHPEPRHGPKRYKKIP